MAQAVKRKVQEAARLYQELCPTGSGLCDIYVSSRLPPSYKAVW